MNKDNGDSCFNHSVQCACGTETYNIITRSVLNLLSKPRFESCLRARTWFARSHPPPNSESTYKSLVLASMRSSFMTTDMLQIEKDLLRTYPDEGYFSSVQGKGALYRCLSAYSVYESSIGYVQGMNFIMASLLWHASESDAFWIFVGLMEDYDLRDTYLPKLPGLSKHCQIIQILSFDFLPEVYRKLAELSINFEMFAAEWCFTLFGSVIPVGQMHHFMDNFLTSGWVYFYRFIIVLLECLEEKLLKANDFFEALYSLKISRNSQKEWNQFISDKRAGVSWEELNKRAFALEIDEQYISCLHKCFCLDTAQFTLRAKKNFPVSQG